MRLSLLAFVLSPLVAACIGPLERCEPGVEVKTLTPIAGEIVWTLGDASGQTTFSLEDGVVSSGLECEAEALMGPFLESEESTHYDHIIRCFAAEPQFDYKGRRAIRSGFIMYVSLPPPRPWVVGFEPDVDTVFSTHADYAEPCHEDGSCRGACDVPGHDIDIALDVTEATGSSAPYPEVVTDDFARTWTVSFEFEDARGVNDWNRLTCSRTLSIRAQLTFRLDASHFTDTDEAICYK